jgi:AcrR family transcriptional regulator
VTSRRELSAAAPADVAVPTSAGAARARMSADDRRAQLVAVGLDLLATRPIHEMAVDEVAAEAGISRTLLFHYFPTKSDYYAAVVQAAAEKVLRPDLEPVGDTPHERVRGMVAGFLRAVERRRDQYVALVRGASGGDPKVLELVDAIRASLVPRWLAAAEVADADARTVLMVRGFLASLEEVALVWDRVSVPHDEVVDGLVAAFFLAVSPPAAS